MSLIAGYDASSTLAPRTGVGRSALALLRAMVQREDEGLQWRVLATSLTRRLGPEHDFLKNRPAVRVERRLRPGPGLVESWRNGTGPAVEALLGDDVQLFHAPASYVPPAAKVRRVVTVHDLAFLNEKTPDRDKLGGAYFAETFERVLPEVDAIHTPSDFVRRDVIRRYGVSPDKVVAIPWGVDRDLFQPSGEQFAIMARNRAGIHSKHYILGVTSHAPRKRTGLLLDAYDELLKRDRRMPPLALLGCANKAPRELRDRPHLHRKVLLLPHMPDKELAGLYTGASCVLFTSEHEGFGFPVLEAMACGAPVVCGRETALRQVAGDAAIHPAADSPEAWADAALPLVFDPEARVEWRERGLEQATRFDWNETAKRMVKLYNDVATWGTPM
ncbi:MAG: glycosyltransferase family 1 protein [Sumerlaeia bacterium]